MLRDGTHLVVHREDRMRRWAAAANHEQHRRKESLAVETGRRAGVQMFDF